MWWVELLNSIVALLESGAGGGGGAYESIASVTGTGSAGAITFSSIPSTYAALQIRIIARDTGAATVRSITFTVNNDTAANYVRHSISADGATANSSGQTAQSSIGTLTITGASAASGISGVGIIDFQDYASTTRNKTIRYFSGYDANGSGTIKLSSGLWLSTSAINRIDLTATNAFDTTSVISLYGIKGA